MTAAGLRSVAGCLVVFAMSAANAQTAKSDAESPSASTATEAALPAWSSESTFLGPPALLPVADPNSEEFVGPPQMSNFRILDQEVLPGARARLEWSASQSFSGSEVVSPVVVAHGVRPGPVLCLIAAIHGDELNGVEIVRRVVYGVDPSVMSGTLIGVPIVNLFGFSRGSRYLPDRRDLNRFFPGSRVGSIASRIAQSFFDNVVSHCDAVVDFHTGSFDRSNLPQVRADLRIPEVLEFAGKFGATPVLHSAGAKGMLRTAASRVGIPAVTFESGAPSLLQIPEIKVSVRSIEALLFELGMTADAPARKKPQAIFYDSQWVRADSGGMLISHVVLGGRVVAGQPLGMVVDPINNIEREIKSPINGRVIGMARNQVVLPGFAAYHVGEEKTADAAAEDATKTNSAGAEEEEYSSPPPPDGEEGDDELVDEVDG